MTDTHGKRLFVAVELSLATTKKIAEASQRLAHAARTRQLDVAWVPPPNLHVTLAFLGWAQPEAVDAVRDAMIDVARTQKSFELEARGTGAFPSEAEARVLWIGVQDPKGALAAVAGAIGARMESLGFPREQRVYVPHVTIGRVVGGAGRAAAPVAELFMAYRQATFGTSPIRALTLFESQTGSAGSVYFPLARAPLGTPERQTRGVQDPLDQSNPEEPTTHGRREERSEGQD